MSFPVLQRIASVDRFILLCLVFLLSPQTGYSQFIQDISINYSLMRISEAKLDEGTVTPEFFRHNTAVTFSRNQYSLGFIFQNTARGNNTQSGTPEKGLMLTGDYDVFLNGFSRIEFAGRIGVLSDTDSDQPLYATDTDFRANLVFFNSEGMGWVRESAFFPSAYLGGILNRFGRFQAIAGVGNWWKNLGTYVTVFHSVNGVDNPISNPNNETNRFANLQNSGISLSASIDYGNFTFWTRQNIPLKNGGNDLNFSIQYSFIFNQMRW